MTAFGLSELLLDLPVIARFNFQEIEVKALSDDSRRILADSLFFAINTSRAQGVDFVPQALENGAVAVIAAVSPPQNNKIPWIQVENIGLARLKLAQKFYGNPFENIQCHGITGTNGKTTTVFIMEQVLKHAGYKVALLSTILQRIGTQQQASELSTPGLLDLYAFAARAVEAGCEHLIMEVSSHALDQERIAGMNFSTVLFSNLSQDHLDYHGTLEDYFAAKSKLFTDYSYNHALINIDNAWGQKLTSAISATKLVTVGREKGVFSPQNVEVSAQGIAMTLPQLSEKPIKSKLMGDFNADNLLLVAAWAWVLKLPLPSVNKALQQAYVPGRMQFVYNKSSRKVFVDYAHTPDALERVLQVVAEICTGNLHLVFGCGGDRDKSKRPLMGQVAQKYSRFCWVTSDNPRTEDPQKIIDDILRGMAESKPQVVVDRRVAITQACRALQADDCLIVAGKGHEEFQLVGDRKLTFSDSQVIWEAYKD